MAIKHVVVTGDCFSSLATKFGFVDYHGIYDEAANAALKQRRPNPNALLPGDEVQVPEKKKKNQPAQTGAKYNFVVQAKKVKLRLLVLDSHNKPLEGKPFVLSATGGVSKTGASLPGGFVELAIDPQVTAGSLTLDLGKPSPVAPPPPSPSSKPPSPPPYPPTLSPSDFADALDSAYTGSGTDSNKIEWTLLIGQLPSHNEVEGVQARLANLGYVCNGKQGDASDPETVAAVKAFQRRQKLPETGSAADIQDLLRDRHDRK
jgi:hypothetical protein